MNSSDLSLSDAVKDVVAATRIGLGCVMLKKDEVDEQQLCAICLEELLPRCAATHLTCAHIYHTHCIMLWLQRKQSQPTCPLCRHSITLVSSMDRPRMNPLEPSSNVLARSESVSSREDELEVRQAATRFLAAYSLLRSRASEFPEVRPAVSSGPVFPTQLSRIDWG